VLISAHGVGVEYDNHRRHGAQEPPLRSFGERIEPLIAGLAALREPPLTERAEPGQFLVGCGLN